MRLRGLHCFWFLLPALAAGAEPDMTAEERDAWFNAKSVAEVNEGTLSFLITPPAKAVHHHQNRIVITHDSLASGWTDLAQCHDNLDSVPRAEIRFRDGFIRDLRVLESRGIAQAWVEGPSVQLRDVTPGARLCIEARTRALSDAGSGFFNLANGPYMRKFLDGYYPMHVSLTIRYPAELLHVVAVSPGEQPGFKLRQEPGLVSIDTYFEGELRTQVQFERKAPAVQGTPARE